MAFQTIATEIIAQTMLSPGCLSVCLFARLYLCLSVCLSECPLAYPIQWVCVSVYLPVYVRLCVCVISASLPDTLRRILQNQIKERACNDYLLSGGFMKLVGLNKS